MGTRLLAKYGIVLAPTLTSYERGTAAAAIKFGVMRNAMASHDSRPTQHCRPWSSTRIKHFELPAWPGIKPLRLHEVDLILRSI